MNTYIINITSLFYERRAIACARTHKRKSVIYHMSKSNFDYTFFLHNCLCLIKICAYFHVAMKQTAVVDYQIKVMFMSILILKLLILHRNQKRFLLSPVYNQVKGILVYTTDEKGINWTKLTTRKQPFFKTNLFKKWMKKHVALLKRKNDKEWMGEQVGMRRMNEQVHKLSIKIIVLTFLKKLCIYA